MTFSILARDPKTGHLGVATATGKLAVGAQVPHLRTGLGAIATQGYTTNPLYAEDGFRLLETGRQVESVVDHLTRCDRGHDWRQLIVMSREGDTAGFTGRSNESVLGLILEKDLAIGGNMLASDSVLTAMKDAFLASSQDPLGARLINALKAGEREGGDKRGCRSAALLLEDDTNWPLDLRADFSDHPVGMLDKLFRRSREGAYQDFRSRLPGRSDPHRF